MDKSTPSSLDPLIAPQDELVLFEYDEPLETQRGPWVEKALEYERHDQRMNGLMWADFRFFRGASFALFIMEIIEEEEHFGFPLDSDSVY